MGIWLYTSETKKKILVMSHPRLPTETEPRGFEVGTSLTNDHGKIKDWSTLSKSFYPARNGYMYDASDNSDNHDGDFSAKSTKMMSARNDSFSSNHHHQPTPLHRSRNPPTVDSETAVQTKEDDDT